jgi:hypothetical protein
MMVGYIIIIRYDIHSKRKRYHCVKCNLYFSFKKNGSRTQITTLYISKNSNLKDCSAQTSIFIDLTCEEVLIKRLLE